MQEQAGKCEAEKRLKQLQLADAGDAAERKAPIPENEADQHTEDRDVGEPEPGRGAYVLP